MVREAERGRMEKTAGGCGAQTIRTAHQYQNSGGPNFQLGRDREHQGIVRGQLKVKQQRCEAAAIAALT